MEEKKIKVFVYGTLKKGFGNHSLLNNSKWITDAFIKGSLFSIEHVDYPAFLDVGDFDIYGEVYEVNQRTLAQLDDLEGYHGPNDSNNLYERKEVMAYDQSDNELFVVSVYIYCPKNCHLLTRIESNNYE